MDRLIYAGILSTIICTPMMVAYVEALRPRKTPASNADSIAKAFINAAHIYANDMPIWVTEAGYDINQGVPISL